MKKFEKIEKKKLLPNPQTVFVFGSAEKVSRELEFLLFLVNSWQQNMKFMKECFTITALKITSFYFEPWTRNLYR